MLGRRYNIMSRRNTSDEKSFKDLHLSVDTESDLELVRLIYDKINSRPILFSQILNIISLNPSILQINNSKV